MAFEKRDIKLRKRSYYQFSKNYPGKRSGTLYSIGESRARRKKEKRERIYFAVCLVVLFSLVFLISSIALKLSQKPLENNSATASQEFDGKLRAVYMPGEVLDGGISFELFKAELTDAKANAVMIDFKTEEGYLNYNLPVATADDIGADSHSYENAADTIKQLKDAGYKIIARIYCYEDSVAASGLGAAVAITSDDGSIWLDNSARLNGNPWLNPYSEAAQKYLLSIISETAKTGVDVIQLGSVQFPQSDYIDKAVFAGEDKSIESRNSILHKFIENAVTAAGDIPVSVEMSVNSALNGDALIYDGSIFDSTAAFSAVDFRKADLHDGFRFGENIYSSESTGVDNLLSGSLPILRQKSEENYHTASIIPIIDNDEYVSILDNLGINNYILFIEKQDADT